MIDLSGIHFEGRTNDDVEGVSVPPTSNLSAIPVIIFLTFRNLEIFSIDQNFLTRIDLPFCGPRMKEFTVFLNAVPIPLLQNGAFRGCNTLEKLDLMSTNILQVEDNVFVDLPELRELILFNNTFVEIRSHWLRHQHQIELLRLDQSAITSIEAGAFQCKTFLRNLDLRTNRLERIVTGTFTNMLQLRVLNMEENNIQVIEDGAFANLPSLEILGLSDNRIVVLDSNIFGTTFHNLQHVDLRSNQIDSIDRKVFRRLPAIRTLLGTNNVCFQFNFQDIVSYENDVFPRLENCFQNFDNLSIAIN